MSERTRPVDNDVVPLKHPGRIIAAVVLYLLAKLGVLDQLAAIMRPKKSAASAVQTEENAA